MRIIAILLLVLITSQCTKAENILTHDAVDVAVIGGGPAGLTAAIYSTRAGLSTVVVEGEEPGGQITLSYLIENYPGFPQGINGQELGIHMQGQAARFGATLMNGKVIEAELSKRPFRLKLDNGKELYAKSVIIASGSRTKWLGLPSEEALKGKGVNSCAVCDGFLFKGQAVVVVGGGDAALEDALYLSNLATKVTLIHRGPKFRASKVLQEAVLGNNKIEIVYNTVLEEILDVKKGNVEGVCVKNLSTKKNQTIPCSGVFIAIGHIPNTEIFKGALQLNELGYIITEPFSTKTKIDGVFAAGDVSNPHYRQAVVAAGFGSMAAIDAFQYIQKQGRGK
jgi:thioredoxin reductase (NADPH)